MPLAQSTERCLGSQVSGLPHDQCSDSSSRANESPIAGSAKLGWAGGGCGSGGARRRFHQRAATASAAASASTPWNLTCYSVFPAAGLQVSSLGLGAWSWGDRSRYWQDSINKEENITVRHLAGGGVGQLGGSCGI